MAVAPLPVFGIEMLRNVTFRTQLPYCATESLCACERMRVLATDGGRAGTMAVRADVPACVHECGRVRPQQVVMALSVGPLKGTAQYCAGYWDRCFCMRTLKPGAGVCGGTDPIDAPKLPRQGRA